MNVRTQLACDGWGFIPTYLGEQKYVKDKKDKKTLPNSRLSATQGVTDAKDACGLMTSAGFALGSVVYLDLEYGDPPTGTYQDYVLAWIGAVKQEQFVPAIYCTRDALDWARCYARIVWLAAPTNLDAHGNAVPETLDPAHLPGGPPRAGTVATQFLFEVDFRGLDKPVDVDHGPRFDLNTSLVADPADYASVDDALIRNGSSVAADAAQLAAASMTQAEDDKPAILAMIGTADAPNTSPTSDPRCGPKTNRPDRLMPPDKVSLDVVESLLASEMVSLAMDVGPSEDDLSEMSDAMAAAGNAGPLPFKDVHWPAKDADAPDYYHLSASAALALPADGVALPGDFNLTEADIELVLSANRMDPKGFDATVVLAIRGGRLGLAKDKHPPLEMEDELSVDVTDIRPDHRNFHCLLGFYKRAEHQSDRKITLFTGSTVLNAKYVNSWYRYANGKASSGMGNLLPTGCYVYRVGAHHSPSAGTIKPALRLTDSNDLHADGAVTVIRTKNDETYGVDDVWCKTMPGDNVHCSFQTSTVAGWGAPFSSAGCLTVRGKPTPTDQWEKFQAILKKLGIDKRCDLILITARDLAIAAALRKCGDATKPDIVQKELGRLRAGSQGEEVSRLQKCLKLEDTGYFGSVLRKALVDEQARRKVAIDGVYSPALDTAWGWNVFT